MSFRKFCAELNKGYGESDYAQIARLYEAPDGRIWYDTSWAGNKYRQGARLQLCGLAPIARKEKLNK